MKTHRVTLPPGGIDEFTHTCPGHVDGEPCRWDYHVIYARDDVPGHAEARHADADKAFAMHVADVHPNATPQPHGGT